MAKRKGKRKRSRNSKKSKDRSKESSKKGVQISPQKSVRISSEHLSESKDTSLSGLLTKEVAKSSQQITEKPLKSSHNVLAKARRGSKLATNASDVDQSEIPRTGSRLLEWVRKHAGYEVDVDGEPSEEEIVPEKVKKKKGAEPISDEEKKKEDKTLLHAKGSKKSEHVVVKLHRPPDMEDEIMKLIKKRKQEALALLSSKTPKHEEVPLTSEDETVKTKRKKKKRSPKRKSKKKKKKMSAEQVKMESDKSLKMMEKSKEEEEAEKAEILAAEQRAEAEQVIRMQGVRGALDIIKFNNDYNRKIQMREIQDNYWRLYVECGDLPIVNHIADMTMYLDSWRNVIEETTPEEASRRTRDVLKLLKVLTDFIDNKPPKSDRRLENYKWLREIFRQQLEEMMEKMTFKILRDVTTNMHPIDLETGDFNYKDDRFILCIWLRFQLPKPLFNPRKPPPPAISLNLESIGMNLDFPTSITGEDMVVRVLYLTFDHLSDKSRSFMRPAKPEYYNYNLYDVLEKEWRVKKKYKVLGRYRTLYELEMQKHEALQQEKANYKPNSLLPPPPDLPPMPKFKLPEVDSKDDIPDAPLMKLDPTPDEYAETLEEVNMTNMKASMLYTPEEFEINLRKYIILGGMFIVNLYYQPPQPQHLVTMVLNITSFILPKKIATVPFYESYVAPPPSTEQKTPEELESLIKLQEEAFEKLLLITITLPKHVMYLEPPIVCMWEEEDEIWSTKDIHDIKQNEEKGTVSFRTGRFGIFGLATFRYGNLPYQAWEIKPDLDGDVIFQLTAAILMFEFKIKGSLVTVTQFQNGPNNALQDIVTKTFPITKLATILREGGVDIFPDYDAFCYVTGSCEKHWPTEYICYYDMAHLSTCFNFAWSRWNATEGYRSLVMQARIYNPELQTQKPHSLVLVTPLRASFINCTEVTPVFCSDAIEGSKFCSTLWNLSKCVSTIYVRNKVQEISEETIHTVAKMLIGTRILSFC